MLLFLTSCIKKSSSFLHLFALFVFDNLLHTSFESFISWLRISFESFDYFMLSFWQKALYHSSIAFSFLGIFFSCSKNCHSMGCDLSIQVLEENKIIFGLRGLTIKMLFQIEKSYLFPFRSGVIRNTTRYFIFWLKKGVPVFLGRSSFPALLLIFALQISLSFFLSFFCFPFWKTSAVWFNLDLRIIDIFLGPYCTLSVIPTPCSQFRKKCFHI